MVIDDIRDAFRHLRVSRYEFVVVHRLGKFKWIIR